MTVLVFALTLIVPPALAGPPDDASLVEDINPTVGVGSVPTDLTAVGNTLFFLADNGTNGEELWKSDGTPGGAELVKDINETPGVSSNAEGLTSFNGKLYFAADNGINGWELWVSDGTEDGTAMLKDIDPGDENSHGLPSSFAVVNGTLFFSAYDGGGALEHARELWKSDGTGDGTEMVKDINATGGFGSGPVRLTGVGSTVYFTASNGSSGAELWKSDGTGDGTEIVEDIHPSAGSDPQELINFNGTLFFNADDGSTGRELYKATGDSSTEMVEDINPVVNSQVPAGLTVVGNTLYFAANDGIANHGRELWKSNGTAAGTDIVKDIIPGGGRVPRRG